MIITEILKNYLITVPVILKFSQKFLHRTGALNDARKVEKRFNEIISLLEKNSHPIKIDSLLEIGPGQTCDLIFRLNTWLSPKACLVSDVTSYFPDTHWQSKGVEPLHGDLSAVEDGSIDLIYCYDVLEHLTNPAGFMREISRVLSPQGLFFASWDLRDHLFIHDEKRWFDMHRFSETSWLLQRSNRTSYSNRLLPDQWHSLFERNGLKSLDWVQKRSPLAQSWLTEELGIEVSDVYRLHAVLSKNSSRMSV